MTRFAVGVEYDGSAFAGWQEQQDAPSVQRAVTVALSRILDHPLQITAAGRTDAGVHSRGQVAHFDTSAMRSERALVLGANTLLPPGIALRWARSVADHFHARYSALARTYRYCILNRSARSALAAGRVAFIHRPLDASRMQAAAMHLVGNHDFSALRAAECQAKSPVRELSGLVTLREIVRGLDSLGGRLLETPVRKVMDAKPAAVRPEDSADSLRTTMTDRHVSHVPVVKDDALVGIISFHVTEVTG